MARLSTGVFIRQLQNSSASYPANNSKVSRAPNYIHCSFTRRSSSQTGLPNPYQKKAAPIETDHRKALLLAHQNLQDPRFKVVVDCLSGILFLGTPHTSITDEDTLLRHNQILYSCAKISMQKQSSRLPAHDVFQLANLAATFEQIANVPVLSVYEDADQRSNMQRILGKGKKVRPSLFSNHLIDFCRYSSMNNLLLFPPMQSASLVYVLRIASFVSYPCSKMEHIRQENFCSLFEDLTSMRSVCPANSSEF